MTEPDEATEPQVTDVPEPDQEPHEPIPDEADTTDEEEAEAAETPEPEPEPEPEAQGPTPEKIEQLWKATDRAVNTYVKKVGEIWEESGLALTPFGIDPASPLGFVNMDNAGHIEDSTKDAVLAFLGFAREQDYEPDPETHECTTCKGKGKTKTGSHVAGKETRPCPTCNGSGAQGLPSTVTYTDTNGSGDVKFTLAEPANADAPDADTWEQPRILPDGRENPNYGRMPQYWVQVEPYGDTRNLTAQDAAV